MDNNLWWLILALTLLPVFFGLGWLAARVDIKTITRQANRAPADFYTGLDALIDNKNDKAARYLAEAIDAAADKTHLHPLSLSLGKLYRRNGENDKAIRLHQALLAEADTQGDQQDRFRFELGLDFQNAGLVDRAETILNTLIPNSSMAQQAHQVLLNIYQQDRDWLAAIRTAQTLSHTEQSYQFEIAQFHCEIAQEALFKNQIQQAQNHAQQALETNGKCTRANMILGDIASKTGQHQQAEAHYIAIEKQNHTYLSMIGERLYEACEAQNRAAEGLDLLIGYQKTFPQLDLLNVIYDKALQLYGEDKAAAIAIELVRQKPDLGGVHRLLGLQLSQLNPAWKSDADMMRNVIGRHLQKAVMYRCRHCHFKSQVFFWHCPACNKWETFTPNKIEI